MRFYESHVGVGGPPPASTEAPAASATPIIEAPGGHPPEPLVGGTSAAGTFESTEEYLTWATRADD